MPRQSRIDAPGALHHIICRGIERGQIFEDDTDRNNFVKRLGTILLETKTPCYGWALIPNHFHLLLRTGNVPVSTVMRRLLTGYAVNFNRRHRRSGHLFQNRYKSILCQEETYLLELVRYIHLNPLRARIVADLKQLSHYSYCGHSRVTGKIKSDWQAIDTVLGLFGKQRKRAIKKYEEFVAKGVEEGKKPELTGGGLIRSVGGWQELKVLRRMKIHYKSDERILGDSYFVKEVLGLASEAMERRYRLRSEGYTFESVIGEVAKIFEISPKEIISPGKQPNKVKARSVLAYWAVHELGMSTTEVGSKIGLSQSSISRAVQRGKEYPEQMDLDIEIEKNA
jgi:REP element-mobilizing transposase RayT